MEKFEIGIIGGGPGGYVAAIRAAQLGKKVVVIERDLVGGVCLNWGCIPTKSLLKSAEILEATKKFAQYGISVGIVNFDLAKIIERSREVSRQLNRGIKNLLKKNKVTLIEGNATLEKDNIINITSNNINKIMVEKIIIATGARPKLLPLLTSKYNNVWTSKDALTITTLPKSLIIVGSGAIGIEFANFYNALGVQVTVLEAKANILPQEDLEISNEARKIFEKRNIKFYTDVHLAEFNESISSVEIQAEINQQKIIFKAEKILVAIGITPNIENLGLENYNIDLKNNHINTNEFLQTSEKDIYAIGDVTGGPWLAHKASHEGIIAVEHIAGLKVHGINIHNIPGCIYSFPQIASLGLTEEIAKAQNLNIKVGRFPFNANGKALVSGETEGFIKTIFDAKTGELLGAHMIGYEVTELIHGYVISKTLEATEIDLINSIFPHPTLSEMMNESVLAAFNRTVHF